MSSGNCAICGTYRETLHRDHIKPKWAGGNNNPENIQLICANCHEDKTIKEIQMDEYHNFLSNKSYQIYGPGGRKRYRINQKGEYNSQAKITLEQVKEIRRLYATGLTQKSIGNMFGISQVHVSDITLNKKWKQL